MSKRRAPGPFIRIGTSEFIIDDGEYGLAEQPGPESESQRESGRSGRSGKRDGLSDRRMTQRRKMLNAALTRLSNKYPNGFSQAERTTLMRQIEKIWPKICKDCGVTIADYAPPKWDMVDYEVKRREHRSG